MTHPLTLQEVSAGYSGCAVLQNTTLALNAGEFLAVIGPNGAGKSTLLRVMARQLRPFSGTVFHGGQDAWQAGSRVAAQRVALTPPYVAPSWPLTVEDTVALGRTPHRGWFQPFTTLDKTKVTETLKQNHLFALKDRLVTTLSDGEAQRVTLVRALVQEPTVLLLDEPTAHLDLKYQTETLTTLKALAANGLTVVAALHDINQAARWADRVLVLVNGRVKALGTPTEVITQDLLSQTYGTNVTVVPHPILGTPMVIN